MPKKAKRSSRPARLKVAVPSELLDRIAKVADDNGRSTAKEVESRLRASLTEDTAAQDGRPTPWARALGRLLILLADDLAAASQSADEALVAMKVAAPALIDTLLESFREILGPGEIASVENEAGKHASALAKTLALRVRQAHQPDSGTYNAWGNWLELTQPSLTTLQKAELQKIQSALFLSPEALKKLALTTDKPTTDRRHK